MPSTWRAPTCGRLKGYLTLTELSPWQNGMRRSSFAEKRQAMLSADLRGHYHLHLDLLNVRFEGSKRISDHPNRWQPNEYPLGEIRQSWPQS